jgi:hypothetical protein
MPDKRPGGGDGHPWNWLRHNLCIFCPPECSRTRHESSYIQLSWQRDWFFTWLRLVAPPTRTKATAMENWLYPSGETVIIAALFHHVRVVVAVTLALESCLLELNPLESLNTSPSKRACQCDRAKHKTQACLKSDTICLQFQRRRSTIQTHYRVCLNRARMWISSGLNNSANKMWSFRRQIDK